ncbi:MAG: MBL fold metallo-hydrolase [Steroidobacterales bacterium]
MWLIRGGGRTILFDSGFHRSRWFKYFPVTDIVISHAHWDHLGGIDLFPKATVWIQKDEYRYYTADAWQAGGDHGGIDPDDVRELVRLNTEGRMRLVDGDDVEITPGIRAYLGARHTFASQYLRIDGATRFVLASDNVYLYRNLAEHKASATFTDADWPANIKSQQRMIELAGSSERVVPGHDPAQQEPREYGDIERGLVRTGCIARRTGAASSAGTVARASGAWNA